MKRATLLLALALLTTVLASGTAQAEAPRVAAPPAAVVVQQLQQRLDAAGQNEMVKTIVVLKSQADLAGVQRIVVRRRRRRQPDRDSPVPGEPAPGEMNLEDVR